MTSTAGVFNSMCIEPALVFEEGAKRQGKLPVLVPFKSRRKRAGIEYYVAPDHSKFGHRVARLVSRQFMSNRRHGSHLFGLLGAG